MRRVNNTIRFAICAVVILILVGCGEKTVAVRSRLKNELDTIAVVDCHEHQRKPVVDYPYNFYSLVSNSYFNWDIPHSLPGGLDQNLVRQGDLDELWKEYGSAIDLHRATTFYDQFRRGFQVLYGYDELYFTREGVQRLSGEIRKRYQEYDSWFDEAFKRAGFDIMLLDQWWDTFNLDIDTRYFALVFRINTLVMAVTGAPETIHYDNKVFYKLAEDNGFPMNTLDEYLAFCDYLIRQNLEYHAVALKNSLAYVRPLTYEQVTEARARDLFTKPYENRSGAENTELEDFMFHWIIEKSIEVDLPVQIHTGYGASVLENGRPSKLNNLFVSYPRATFILFHGGYPWTGEYIALAKRFPNVYLDLVWLPQISREAAVRTLDELLDCVPYNKIFWGGDCHLIEEAAGSLEIARDVVAEVLAARVGRGLMTEEVARDIGLKIFRENAVRIFNLEVKLGRSFEMSGSR